MLPKCENWLHVTLDGRKDMWTLLNVSSTHDKHTWHGIYLLHMLWLKIILYGPLWWGKCFLGCFESRSVWKEYWEGNRRCFQVKMSLWCEIVSKTVWAWYIYLVHWMLWLHCFGIRNRRNVINKRILIQ